MHAPGFARAGRRRRAGERRGRAGYASCLHLEQILHAKFLPD
jgi:hypothetical protein